MSTMSDPNTCQHHRINNDTWQCIECGHRMESQTGTTRFVKSAPNLAAGMCANGPDCDGGDGCTAVYIPDHSRAREVPVGVDVTYACDRCRYDGSYISGGTFVASCGRSHRGQYVTAAAAPAVQGGEPK